MSEEEEKGTFIDASALKDRERKQDSAPKKEGKNRDGIYIIIILLLLLGGGYMGYLMSEKNKTLNECDNEKITLIAEMEALNEMMHDEGLAIGENVRQNLQNMISQYC